ncbi:uncharacterized protein Z518_08433 [Rhinocladiella mackenziei CBS 650.93]|uniref:FAD-binding PCMH-type domain-containing protein n=1 Tax=Rhinocladiella mackenziei CBS 650.93 TaxID=1442369 RepID=A0A0D2FKP5_9EURO|nr:uncharacterized protein Z518_08433 [Rhinocladiella mackenziei CBS 650.93]KIX02492.1 hypothetical protein Z518_08433 [Rhinocladiella mackenziei CBS 650.93]
MFHRTSFQIVLAASILLTQTISFTTLGSPAPMPRECKTEPGDADWPSLAEWRAFNISVDGNLLAPLPPGKACDVSSSAFDNDTCTLVGTRWANSSFHAADPVSVDWPNVQGDNCLPRSLTLSPDTPCDGSVFPQYVVNASTGAHVAEAVKFAGTHGVRLSVKGTGHDFLGRSTAPGLAVWTRHIRGIEIWPPHSSSHNKSGGGRTGEGLPVTMKIAAGHSMRDVYAEAEKKQLSVVLGADANVGVGGFLTGGGHSPISARFGLGVDNVMEMEVVTPRGEIVVTNEREYSDLFWAMRGGGGATFGILLSVTIKTYPKVNISRFNIAFNSTDDEAARNNNSNWYAALTEVMTGIPHLSESGVMGQVSTYPLSLLEALATGSQPPLSASAEPMGFVFSGVMLDPPEGKRTSLLDPILMSLNNTDGIMVHFSTEEDLTLYDLTASDGTVGRNAIVASRLWDRKAVSDKASLTRTFQVLQKDWVQGLMVTGPRVREVQVNYTSVNPAWRRAYLHVLTTVGFPYNNATAEQEAKDRVTHVLGKALRDQALDTGCYLNEANPDEPDFQRAFWGEHYEKLKEIKRKYDPEDTLWCKVCVGSEGWGYDSGMRRICRV